MADQSWAEFYEQATWLRPSTPSEQLVTLPHTAMLPED